MQILEVVADDIWIAEGKIVDFYGFPYPTRSVIVRLPDATLWIWSPVALTSELKAEIDTLGRPMHLVSPNKIHHLYLQDWIAAYPNARLWGPASTIKKRSDLTFEPALEETVPEDWLDVFELAWFRGSRFLDEILFFHKASKTVIIADMSENFTDTFLKEHWSSWKRWIAPLWGIVEGKGYAPLELRLSFLNKTHLRRARDEVLEWNAEKVIMAHGRWQKADGRAFLERSFKWIG